MRTLLRTSAAVVALLVLAGCTESDDAADEASPTATPTRATSPEPTTTPTPTAPSTPDGAATPTPEPTGTAAGDPAAEVPGIADTCTIDVTTGEPDQVRIAYPEGWLVEEGCTWFDPEAESVEDDTEPAVSVSWRVAPVAFADAADVTAEVADPIRFVGARSGYQAVRIEGEATGQGLRQQGEPVVTWLVDLDPGSDDQGGTLIGTAHVDGGASFDAAAYALDRMADTMLVEPPAADAFVVTRLEGGGTPVTVTWAADDGCFRLHAGGPTADVVDEACGPMTPGSSGYRLFLLEDDQTRLLAGLSAPRVQRVTVPAASTLSGATTQSTEGGNVFALPVRRPPFEVTGLDDAGEVVSTLEFGR